MPKFLTYLDLDVRHIRVYCSGGLGWTWSAGETGVPRHHPKMGFAQDWFSPKGCSLLTVSKLMSPCCHGNGTQKENSSSNCHVIIRWGKPILGKTHLRVVTWHPGLTCRPSPAQPPRAVYPYVTYVEVEVRQKFRHGTPFQTTVYDDVEGLLTTVYDESRVSRNPNYITY